MLFQRYGRVKQNGLGDDILSGNSLTVVGLYQAIYGINPLYNRLYLDPHITSELAGTALRYKFRGQRLVIGLDDKSYSVSNSKFKVISSKRFGFNATKNELLYFEGNSAVASLKIITDEPLTINIENWTNKKIDWLQTVSNTSVETIDLFFKTIKPRYSIQICR